MKSLVDCRRRTLRNRVRAAVRRSSVLKTAILAACAFALAYAPDTDLFYVVDSGANAVYSITPAGVSEVAFQWTDNPVPTGIAIGPEGDLYVALFTHLPYETGAGSIVRVAPDGAAAVVTSLTTPIDVGFDSDGRMYVLEFSGGYDPRGPEGLFKPDSGRLLRIDQSKREVLLDGLSFPTRMFFSPTGELYLVHGGALSASGVGSVLKLTPCNRARRPLAATPADSRSFQ